MFVDTSYCFFFVPGVTQVYYIQPKSPSLFKPLYARLTMLLPSFTSRNLNQLSMREVNGRKTLSVAKSEVFIRFWHRIIEIIEISEFAVG